MKKEIQNRLKALRQEMKNRNLDAFIIPSTDPHMSEYVAPHWGAREWLSGFTGSAGTVVVTQKMAGLWTDSRYFIQAEEQLKDTGITLYKEMLPETPSIAQMLCSELQTCGIVGIDGQMFSLAQYESLRQELESAAIQIESDTTIIAEIGKEIFALHEAPVFVFGLELAGNTYSE